MSGHDPFDFDFDSAQRPSTVGAYVPRHPELSPPDVEYFAPRDPGTSRVSEEQRLAYLDELQTHGQRDLAARAVGSTTKEIGKWLDTQDDGTFQRAIDLVLVLRSQAIVERLEREAIEGHLEPVVNKAGDVVGHKRKLETALRVRVLARHDPGYRDRQEVEVTGDTGVMLLPQPAASPDHFAAMAEAAKKG